MHNLSSGRFVQCNRHAIALVGCAIILGGAGTSKMGPPAVPNMGQ